MLKEYRHRRGLVARLEYKHSYRILRQMRRAGVKSSSIDQHRQLLYGMNSTTVMNAKVSLGDRRIEDKYDYWMFGAIISMSTID